MRYKKFAILSFLFLFVISLGFQGKDEYQHHISKEFSRLPGQFSKGIHTLHIPMGTLQF